MISPSSGYLIDPGVSAALIVKLHDGRINNALTQLFVPIILSLPGLNNSFFTSELTFVNKGPDDVTIELNYAAAFGAGSGMATDTLTARQVRVIPDAIAYLRGLGLQIPETGNHGGTLRIGMPSTALTDVSATLRTTTPVAQGRVGLAYAGLPAEKLLTSPAQLCGLRQNFQDRSNVAFQNAGGPTDGEITLQATVYSADGKVAGVLPEIVLAPGGFFQVTGVLNSFSLENGRIRVVRLHGTAPYYCYGVTNDQANSDGSFIAPQLEAPSATQSLVLPVIVETSRYSSELVLTNWSSEKKMLNLEFVSDSIQSPDHLSSIQLELQAGQQQFIPEIVQYYRQHGSGMPLIGHSIAGAVFASVEGGDCQGIFMAARTATLEGAGMACFIARCPTVRHCQIWSGFMACNKTKRTALTLR